MAREYTRRELEEIARAKAREFGVPEDLGLGVIEQESGWDPYAKSSDDARGLMQVRDIALQDVLQRGGTSLTADSDLYDPVISVTAGMANLANMNRIYGDPEWSPAGRARALAAYNAGSGSMDRWISQGRDVAGGDIPFAETRDYIPGVERRAKKYITDVREEDISVPAVTEEDISGTDLILPTRRGAAPVPVEPPVPVDQEEMVPEEPVGKVRPLLLPTGEIFYVYPDTSNKDAYAYAEETWPEAFRGIRSKADASAWDHLIASGGRAFGGLLPGMGSLYEGATTYFGGVGDEEAYDQYQEALIKESEWRDKHAPGGLSFAEISKIYEEDGILAAADATTDYAAQTIMGSFGFMAPTFAGAGVGAAVGAGLGAVFAGPGGAVAGAKIGASALGNLSAMATFLSEQMEGLYAEGGVDTKDVDVPVQLGAAAASAALNRLSYGLAGRGFAQLTRGGQRAMVSAAENTLAKLDRTTGLKRVVAALGLEEVTELSQEALERFATGAAVSPFDPEAANQYIEVAFGTLFPGTLFGAVGAGGSKLSELNQRKFEKKYVETKKERTRVRRESEKLDADTRAMDIEDEAARIEVERAEEASAIEGRNRRAGWGRAATEEGARLSAEAGRSAREAELIAQGRITLEDIHAILKDRNIAWDDDPGFESFTKRLTGEFHLDDLARKGKQAELNKLYERISAMPVQDIETRLQLATNDIAIDIASKLGKGRVTDAKLAKALRMRGPEISDANKAEIFDAYRRRLLDLGVAELDAKNNTVMKSGKNPVSRDLYDQIISDTRVKGEFPAFFQFGKYGIRSRKLYDDILGYAITRGDVAMEGEKAIPSVPTESVSGVREGAVEEYIYTVSEEPETRWLIRGPGNRILASERTKSAADAARKRLAGQGLWDFVSGGEVVSSFDRKSDATRAKREFDEGVRREEIQKALGRYSPTAAEPGAWNQFLRERRRALGTAQVKRAEAEGRAAARIRLRELSPEVVQKPIPKPVKRVGFSVNETRTYEDGRVRKNIPVSFNRDRRSAENARARLEERRIGRESWAGEVSGPRKVERISEVRRMRAEPAGVAAEEFPAPVPLPELQPEVAPVLEPAREVALRKYPPPLDEFTAEERKRIEEIVNEATKLLNERSLQNIKLEIVERLSKPGAEAEFEQVRDVIEIALTPELLAVVRDKDMKLSDAVAAIAPLLNHETIHALRILGAFTPKEWSVLSKYVSKRAVPEATRVAAGLAEGATFLDLAYALYAEKGVNASEARAQVEQDLASGSITVVEAKAKLQEINDKQALEFIGDDYIEEAVAFSFAEWSKDRKVATGQVSGIFNRITTFFRKLGQGITGQGFNSAEDIFENLYGDKYGQRVAAGTVYGDWHLQRQAMRGRGAMAESRLEAEGAALGKQKLALEARRKERSAAAAAAAEAAPEEEAAGPTKKKKKVKKKTKKQRQVEEDLAELGLPSPEARAALAVEGVPGETRAVGPGASAEIRAAKVIPAFNDGNVDDVLAAKLDLKNLDRVRGGSVRKVFDLGDGRVIKVATHPRGLEQNASMGLGDETILGNKVPHMYEQGLDYLVMEKVPRNDKAVRRFLKPLQKFTSTDWKNKTPELQDALIDLGLDEFMNYNILWNDFIAARNWGQRADGSFALVDEGAINEDVTATSGVSDWASKDWDRVKILRRGEGWKIPTGPTEVRASRTYGFTQTMDRDANVAVLRPGTRERILKNITWFRVPFDDRGKRVDKTWPAVVFQGHHEDGNKGFGAKHLASHDGEIKLHTPYSSWQELLEGFARAMSLAPKDFKSGSIYSHVDGSGRSVFLWDDPDFTAPVTIVMDARMSSGRGDVDHYSLITAYPSEQYIQPTGAYNQRSGIPPLHGNPSARAFMDYLRPEVARRFTDSQERRASLGVGTNTHSVEETKALDAAVPAKGSRKNLFQALFSGPDSLVGDETKRQQLIERFRAAIFDQYNRIHTAGVLAHKKAKELGLEWGALYADTSAHAAALAVDRAAGYFSATMKYGTMVHRDGISSVENIEWYKKKANGEYELDESGNEAAAQVRVELESGSITESQAESRLLEIVRDHRVSEHTGLRNRVPGRFLDRETGEIVWREAYADIYPDGGDAGLLPILTPISTPSNNIVREFFGYLIALRGYRLDKKGNPVPLKKSEMVTLLGFADKHPEIPVVAANYNTWNDGLIDFQMETGVIDAEMARVWRETADYVPYFVGLEGGTTDAIEEVMKALGSPVRPGFIDSIVGVSPPKKLKGHELELMEPVEAISKNSMAAITAGLKNVAGRRAIRDGILIGWIRPVHDPPKEIEKLMGVDHVKIRIKGKDKYYVVDDALMYQVLVGTADGRHPFGELLTKPSKWLRELVTRTPEFMVANMMRDSLSVWTVNQGDSNSKFVGDFVPIISSLTQFGRGLAAWKRGEVTEQYKQLEKHGVIGGYELSRLTDKELTRYFAKGLGVGRKGIPILSKAWDVLGEASARSESSTRELVYESTYLRVLNELSQTGMGIREAERKAQGEAAFQAQEILNFSRHGNATWIRFLTSVVPFLNSRLQGLDVIGRNISGMSTLRKSPEQIRRAIILRGLMLSAMTMAYTMLLYDDEDYQNQRPEVRDDYWLIPMPGKYFFSIPIPFEAGVLFKVMPEMFTRLLLGGSSREFRDSAKHAMISTLNFNPIPQAVKPALESFVNYNFFTGRPIVPFYMEGMVGGYGARASTSVVSQGLGRMTGISPLKFENLFRGYMGGMGAYGLEIVDNALRILPTGIPGKPMPRITDLPFFRRFLRDEFEGGLKSQFYGLSKSIEGVVKTINYLEKDDPEAALELRMEHAGLLGMRDAVKDIDKSLSELRTQKNFVYNSDMGRFDKRSMLDSLERQENMILSHIGILSRMAGY